MTTLDVPIIADDSDMRQNLELAARVKEAGVAKLTIAGMKIQPYPYQLAATGFLFFTGRGLLADKVGLGKTIECIALIQLLKDRGQLTRCVVVTVAASVPQWVDEIKRFTTLRVELGRGSRQERLFKYASRGWDILVTNYEIVLNDHEKIAEALSRGSGEMRESVLILDEASKFKHHDTRTAWAVKQVAKVADRVIPASATPIQNSLLDLHSIWETIYPDMLGPLDVFRYRYCRWERQQVMRGGRSLVIPKIVGYKNLDHLREITDPYIIRRGYEDIPAGQVPEVVIEPVYGEMLPEQQTEYTAVRKKAIEFLRGHDRRGVRLSMHTMQQVVDGTYTVGLPTDISWKLDWITQALRPSEVGGGALANEKVVIFSMYKRTIAALSRRLRAMGVSYGLMTGDESKEDRYALQKRFMETPEPQVIIGTSALEMSLNLQMARYMVQIDYIRNPKRMEQLYGRIRRIGSPYSNIVVIQLITSNTFEERIPQVLARREAVSDFMLGDDSSGFFAELNDEELRIILGF